MSKPGSAASTRSATGMLEMKLRLSSAMSSRASVTTAVSGLVIGGGVLCVVAPCVSRLGSADARVVQTAGEPAADIDTGDAGGCVALEGECPVARWCVIQGAWAGQHPDVRADRAENFHASRAEKT